MQNNKSPILIQLSGNISPTINSMSEPSPHNSASYYYYSPVPSLKPDSIRSSLAECAGSIELEDLREIIIVNKSTMN